MIFEFTDSFLRQASFGRNLIFEKPCHLDFFTCYTYQSVRVWVVKIGIWNLGSLVGYDVMGFNGGGDLLILRVIVGFSPGHAIYDYRNIDLSHKKLFYTNFLITCSITILSLSVGNRPIS